LIRSNLQAKIGLNTKYCSSFIENYKTWATLTGVELHAERQ